MESYPLVARADYGYFVGALVIYAGSIAGWVKFFADALAFAGA